MRRFLTAGDGLPLASVTLLVCAPVLFGLALIIFEPFRDPSWISDIFFNPARYATIVFSLIYFLQVALSPTAWIKAEEDGGRAASWTKLGRVADMTWAMAAGTLLCLMIVVERDAVDTSSEDVAVYIAFGLTLLSVALRWRDRHERMGFQPRSLPTE